MVRRKNESNCQHIVVATCAERMTHSDDVMMQYLQHDQTVVGLPVKCQQIHLASGLPSFMYKYITMISTAYSDEHSISAHLDNNKCYRLKKFYDVILSCHS